MFGSNALEIAIGIVFVYLLLSLLCTVINEGIANFLEMRGKNLLEGVKNLLNDLGSSRVDLQACKLEYSIVSPK